MTNLSEYLGRTCQLQVIRRTDNGVYLSPEEDTSIQILLPKGQVPEGTKLGDLLENIFIYRDSEDRAIATTAIPKLQMGEVARLSVKEVTQIGAFLDWGLAKDLFLPFKEQTVRVKPGDTALIALYLDKSERLCGTMHVYDYLENESPYKKDEYVTACVYEITETFGVFAAVDDKYSALVPHNEMNREFHVGDTFSARIKQVREDGKLTLSLQEKVHLQIGVDAELVLERLVAAGGKLPFHDKTSPEIIKREFKMSKNAFKRAIGHLLKEKIIQITENGIEKL